MYKKTDKRRLYQLINMYLAGKIDETAFCNEFYYSYDLELDYDTLVEDEYKTFYELSEITSRFSAFEEDHKEHPGVFYTKKELKQKVVDTKKCLNEYFKQLKKTDN